MPQYLSQNNLQQILESSLKKPLYCLFYQDVPECDSARNALTTAISDNNEYVNLVLCDIQDPAVQYLAMNLGLVNVPTLVVVNQGKPEAVLEGTEQITSQLQQTLNDFMPSGDELLMRDALAAESQGDIATALTKAAQAYNNDSKNLSFKFIYVRLLIANKQTAKARELLDAAGREEKNYPEYQQLLSALDLAEQAQNSPELMELEQKYVADPSDENAVAYAIALADCGRKEEALDLLLAKLKQDLNKAEVKKTYLDIVSTMGGDKNQSAYRRKLYTLMY